MSRPIYSLSIYDLKPRPNVPMDNLDRLTGKLIVETAVLAFLCVLIAMLIMSQEG